MSESLLQTGDILLFSSQLTWNPLNIFGKLIEWATKSPYCHVGMVLKDPTWIKPDMKGIYLWQSSYEGLHIKDPQDNKIKVGVEITKLKDVLKDHHTSIYTRLLSPEGRKKLTPDILKKIHNIVYDKIYDFNPIDWLAAYLRKPIDGSRKTNRFFCSALVACIYTESGILDKNTDWSLVRPSDFAPDDQNLKWEKDCDLKGLLKLK